MIEKTKYPFSNNIGNVYVNSFHINSIEQNKIGYVILNKNFSLCHGISLINIF